MCETIADGDYVSSYRATLDAKHDQLKAEVADLEIEHARELAGEAAIEFLRDSGTRLTCITSREVDELEAVMARIKELDELESSR